MAVNLEKSYSVAQASVSDSPVTATASPEDAVMGYTNLGIANISEGNLNVRSGADETSSIVGKMKADSACEIIGYEGDWAQITSGKVEGYVKAEYLLTGEAAVAKAYEVYRTIATVQTDGLRIRLEPNTESTIIAVVSNGEEIEVEEDLGDWVHVSVDGEDGYVSAEYVTVADQLEDAMTLEEIRYGMGVSDARVSLVNEALKYVGNPYVWGGTSLTKGADCSGFVLSIYRQFGISLPHSSSAQSNYGRRISASEAKPGDLFFYGSGRRISHVAIYIGNGQIVHASSRKTGIKISNAFYRTPICVTSLIN